MRRVLERFLIIGLALGGVAYGERVVRGALAMIARIDPAHLHGIELTGSAMGLAEAAIAAAAILFAVVPAALSVFDVFDGRKMPARLVAGELVAALLLFGASERVLHQSVRVHIVGTGDARVLAVQASATTQAGEAREAIE